jgi:hypothetical protein
MSRRGLRGKLAEAGVIESGGAALWAKLRPMTPNVALLEGERCILRRSHERTGPAAPWQTGAKEDR